MRRITSMLDVIKLDAGESAQMRFLKEVIGFGIRQILSCFFPAFIFLMLILSRIYVDMPLPRYDFLLISCVAMQVVMYLTHLETGSELLVISLFHILGTTLEVYKVSMGSWYYPDDALSKFYGVPIYSGFMYASVGSYVCQAWRWFRLRVENWPGAFLASFICVAIYVNFFTHHFLFDFRWVITILLVAIFWNTNVVFTANEQERKMPLILSFFLIGFFIWVGENIATFLGAWKYTTQHEGWSMVSFGKISSWFLLVVLSIVLVVQLKFWKSERVRTNTNTTQ